MRNTVLVTFLFFTALLLNYQHEQKFFKKESSALFDKVVDTFLVPNETFEYLITEDLNNITQIHFNKHPHPINRYELFSKEGSLYFRYKPHLTFNGTDTVVIYAELIDSIDNATLNPRKDLLLMRVNNSKMVAYLERLKY